MKKSILFVFLTLIMGHAVAQQPFEKYGYKVKVATLSKGEYQEFFDQDTLVQIGSVVLNTLTGKITHFVTFDTTYSEATLQPELISRWLSPDPLADKYYSLSPYAFVANNPIKFVDPDGRRIVFANGASKEFKQAFKEAVQYLNKHGAGGMLAGLEKSKQVYTIKEGEGIGTYSPKTRTITWDTNMGVVTTKGEVMSPAAVLNHEADHGNQHDKNPDQYNKDRKTKDDQYGNLEEKRVIEGSEQDTAHKTGESKQGDVTRTDHEGTGWETTGPTSTTGKNEIIITPPKEEKKDDKKKNN